MNSSVLDDRERVSRVDPGNMLRVVESWADQWGHASELIEALPGVNGAFSNVIVCGMGGSGIAGDVARSLIDSPMPIEVVRGTRLPAYANSESLVICVSYSGNTAETLSCFDDAVRRDGTVVAICSGGELAERARAHDAPLFDGIPKGLMPRAALAYLVVPVLGFLQRAGVVSVRATLEEGRSVAKSCVSRWAFDVPIERNDAKRFAEHIGDSAPIVWGAEGFHVPAIRLKAQLAENAKLPATVSLFPELCHNDIVGVHHGHPSMSESVLVVLGPARRDVWWRALEAAVKIAGSSVRDVISIDNVTGILDAIILSDFVSVYAAILRGVDPSPIEAIRLLKASL